MQRDQKVGLALGVLLIGAVAAFFFRNETHPARRAPTLERAAEVDREIAEKKLIPYFTPKSSDANQPENSDITAAQRSDEPDVRTGERRLPSWDEIQAEHVDPFAAEAGIDAVPAPAPDPIRLESPPEAVAKDLVETTTGDSVVEQPSSTAETIYEVQRGDTLSSIAGKYLGSQAKFLDVFEANRDQLRDANDLQIGMKLRIPNGKPRTATPVVPTSLISTDTATALAEAPLDPSARSGNLPSADPPKLKFKPAKRRPTRGSATTTP